MSSPKNKAELLEKMAAGRKEWDDLLARVSDQEMKKPNVEGVWSIKDVLAHICAYEQYMAATIADQKGQRGQATAALDSYYQTNLTMYRAEHPDLPAQISEVRGEQVNEVFVASFRYKAPAEVRQMEAEAYQNLLAWVEACSEEELGRALTENGATLLMVIPNQCYLHYQQHIPTIRAWLEKKDL